MSRRADKALLLFSTGEVTPLLAGRTDVEKITAGCRTLQNMVVDIGGGVTRRAGTTFIAGAKEVVTLSYESLEGTATYYGITELDDVSDPPRKYLHLVPNYNAMTRVSGGQRLGVAAYNRTAYNTSGTRIEQVQAWVNVSSGSPFGASGGESLASPGDSLESIRWDQVDSPFTNAEPTWQRDRLSKWFTLADVGSPGSSTDTEHFGQGFGRKGAIVGSILGVGVTLAWNGSGWTLTVLIWQDDASNARQTYIRVITGDQDPGTVTSSDFVFSTASQFASQTLYLPPDCSIRFMTRISGDATSEIQVPQQIGTSISSGDEGASGLTVDAYDRWLYLGESLTLQEEWRFEETLCNEDTLEAAMNRGSFTAGSSEIATTTALSGGLTAESNTPIVWTGRISKATKIFTGLTAGHIYSVSVLVRTNTIGLTDYVNSIDATGGNFTAVAPTHAYTFTVKAPLGFERKALDMSASDLGATAAAPTTYNIDTIVWWGKVLAAGGSVTAAELAIADALVVEMKAQGLWTKCCYFLPMLGGFAGILVPLRDRDTAGNSTKTAFVAGDYSLSTGLQGNGSSKLLTIPRTPGEIGSSSNGGLGYWALEVNTSGTSTAGIGTGNSVAGQVYRLIPRATDDSMQFCWGTNTNRATSVEATWTGLIYAQRASATSRVVSRDDVDQSSNVTSDSANDPNDADFKVLGDINIAGAGTTRYTAGRCGCAWFDDGTLTSGQRTALYTMLRDDLMTPTGRI